MSEKSVKKLQSYKLPLRSSSSVFLKGYKLPVEKKLRTTLLVTCSSSASSHLVTCSPSETHCLNFFKWRFLEVAQLVWYLRS
jgi:hypothetical protein